jgi:hypothetical protein
MATDQPLGQPTSKDVLVAAERVRPFVHRTPLLTSSAIDEACGRRIVFKAEHLQKVGAYKARGATNQVRTLLENGPPPRGDPARPKLDKRRRAKAQAAPEFFTVRSIALRALDDDRLAVLVAGIAIARAIRHVADDRAGGGAC